MDIPGQILGGNRMGGFASGGEGALVRTSMRTALFLACVWSKAVLYTVSQVIHRFCQVPRGVGGQLVFNQPYVL